MNEEQKQAIKELKHFISMTAFWKEKEYTSYAIDNCIGIVLHLIDKQQKEIENLKEIWYMKDKKIREILDYNETIYIRKDKIKELIEELESVLDLAERDKKFAKYKKEALKEEINDLKELLGETND